MAKKGGNPQNFKPLTAEELRIRQINGGKRAAESKRKKKLLKEVINELLNGTPTEKLAEAYALSFGMDISTIDNQTLMVLAQYKKALEGDPKAFELLRDTAGQKPVEKTEVTGANGSQFMPSVTNIRVVEAVKSE